MLLGIVYSVYKSGFPRTWKSQGEKLCSMKSRGINFSAKSPGNVREFGKNVNCHTNLLLSLLIIENVCHSIYCYKLACVFAKKYILYCLLMKWSGKFLWKSGKSQGTFFQIFSGNHENQNMSVCFEIVMIRWWGKYLHLLIGIILRGCHIVIMVCNNWSTFWECMRRHCTRFF